MIIKSIIKKCQYPDDRRYTDTFLYNLLAIAKTLYKLQIQNRIQNRIYYFTRFGGVRPSSASIMLVAAKSDIFERVSSVAEAICGVKMTLSS